MTLHELVKEAACRGISLTIVGSGDRLRVKAPRGTLTPELRQALAQYKCALLTWLHHRMEGACHTCQNTRFWFSVHRALICTVCHPPAAPSLVVEWIEIV